MCDTCGCNEGKGYSIINPADKSHVHHHLNDREHDPVHHEFPQTLSPHHHEHPHTHDHPHPHPHDYNHQRISIETDILQQNNLLAMRNRGYFEARHIFTLNLVSSPGSGKTTLLERTIREYRQHKIYVIEGDQQTSLDADRIHATGVPVMQVNTGSGCHLDAGMVNHAVKMLDPAEGSLLLIENVGNLVCPSLFDLGEQFRVVIISTTEGEDKPLKYPNMFQSAQLCLVNKTDLLPHVDFDLARFKKYANQVNPGLEFISLSAKTGEGFSTWLDWVSRSSQISH